MRKRKRVKDYHEFYVYLQELLEPYARSDWRIDKEVSEELKSTNDEAKKIILKFYKELSNVQPDEVYEGGRFHTSYLLQLFPMRRAFEEENYAFVCNELQTILHYEPFLQPRVYYNILKTIEYYLDVERE